MRYSLGAEELIELGKPRATVISQRRPFLGSGPSGGASGRPFIRNRPKARMGDILDFLGDAAGFIANFLGGALNLLADIVQVPLDILGSGVDIVFTNVADLLGEIPIIGTIAAQIVVMGNAVIQWALKVPGELLGGLGNVLQGLGKALSSEYTGEEEGALKEEAKNKIIDKAPDAIKSAVRTVLSGPPAPGGVTPPGGGGSGRADQPPAGTELEDVLKVGLPIAGGAALLAVLLS